MWLLKEARDFLKDFNMTFLLLPEDVAEASVNDVVAIIIGGIEKTRNAIPECTEKQLLEGCIDGMEQFLFKEAQENPEVIKGVYHVMHRIIIHHLKKELVTLEKASESDS